MSKEPVLIVVGFGKVGLPDGPVVDVPPRQEEEVYPTVELAVGDSRRCGA